MRNQDVIEALERVKQQFDCEYYGNEPQYSPTKGGYFRVGNVAIKISEIEELK